MRLGGDGGKKKTPHGPTPVALHTRRWRQLGSGADRGGRRGPPIHSLPATRCGAGADRMLHHGQENTERENETTAQATTARRDRDTLTTTTNHPTELQCRKGSLDTDTAAEDTLAHSADGNDTGCGRRRPRRWRQTQKISAVSQPPPPHHLPSPPTHHRTTATAGIPQSLDGAPTGRPRRAAHPSGCRVRSRARPKAGGSLGIQIFKHPWGGRRSRA